MQSRNRWQLLAVSLSLSALVFAPAAFAAETIITPEVDVVSEKLQPLPTLTNSDLDQSEMLRMRANTCDTASLLDGQPGVSLVGAGGVSRLPAIHGMADDRVRVKVNGMDLISGCANHMNPPLSYIDPANVASVSVFAGITPVSVGGDSIGGTIQVNSAAPEFAEAGEGTLFKGQAATFYRSNNDARGVNLSANLAGESLSMRYTGSVVKANNYRAGDDFKPAGSAYPGGGWMGGDEVGSSYYKSENHALAFGLRNDNHLFELGLGLQHIPYEGFPNQRMDMTENNSDQINLRYLGQYQWGNLETRVYNENTRHTMNFGDDKQYWYGNAPGMPMKTKGENTGVLVKGDMILSERDILRVGAEYQRYRLNDWWPASGTGMMMSPNTFQNINDGQRDRYDVFAEWESRWNQQWVTQLGLRNDTVKTDTGKVHGYNNMGGMMGYGNPVAPTSIPGAFNAADRQDTDNNIDLTALARFTPDAQETFEVGYGRKTRSPNLYERYAWAYNNTMVMNMNNWYGDGNGYVGNLNLDPEVAHTLSVTGNWHDAAREGWNFTVAPYYTRVENYIDAVPCTEVGKTSPKRTDGFFNLSLDNQTARLYGVDVSGKMSLAKTGDYGNFNLAGVLNYVRGKNLDTDDDLYNIMPLNLTLAFEQRLGNWTNRVEAKLVDAKTHVEAVRKELETAGYGLLNLYSSYEWKQVRFDVGIENLFDRFYDDPVGGAYVGQGASMGTDVPYGTADPGMGRSINTALTLKF
jgi:iron complex outermembrane recepter protein